MIHYTDRIYVAGHTGMVGSAIVRQLIRLGHPRSHIITRTRIELDLSNQAAVQTFFAQEKPDHVYLAAAQVGGIHAHHAQPARFVHQNLLIQANVVDAAFQAGVKKLLLLASSNSYPTTARQPMAEEDLLNGPLDTLLLASTVPQIAGIKLCESYNQQYGNSHGLDYRCVVSCNVYGPGDTYDLHSPVIPTLIQHCHGALLQASPRVVVAGSDTVRREFLFVDDMAEACVYLMELPKAAYAEHTLPSRSHINVGFGHDVSIEDLAQMVANVVGYTGHMVFDNTRPESPVRRLPDCSRLKSLGWEPLMDLETGLELSYMDYRLHHTARPLQSHA